jgi:hypothetical protein
VLFLSICYNVLQISEGKDLETKKLTLKKYNYENENINLPQTLCFCLCAVMLSSFFFLFGADSCLEYERYNRVKSFRTDNSCGFNTISYCVGSRQDKCLEA